MMGTVLKLLKKEWIFINSVMKIQLWMSIAFLVLFPFTSVNMSFTGTIVVPYLLIYGTMAYEERSKGEGLMLTFPVKRRDLCNCKYLLGGIYAVIATIATMISVLIAGMTRPDDAMQQFFNNNILMLGGMMFLITGVYIAFMLPILLKFGTEKAKYIMLGIYMLGFGATWTILPILKESAFHINPFWAVVLCISVYILSYIVGLNIYEKREFR